jgi:hypothetical protein
MLSNCAALSVSDMHELQSAGDICMASSELYSLVCVINAPILVEALWHQHNAPCILRLYMAECPRQAAALFVCRGLQDAANNFLTAVQTLLPSNDITGMFP